MPNVIISTVVIMFKKDIVNLKILGMLMAKKQKKTTD